MNERTTSDIMKDFASIFGSTTMVLPTVMSTRSHTLAGLSALVGVPIAVLGRALEMDEAEADNREHVVLLSSDEQKMLHELGLFVQASDQRAWARHEADKQQIADMAERITKLKLLVKLNQGLYLEADAELDALLCSRIKWMRHPEFRVLSVKSALSDIWDEVKEFIAEPSQDEASDVAFGIGRLLGAFVGKKYVRFIGDGLHVAKCNQRFAEYGHFRSKRALAAQHV